MCEAKLWIILNMNNDINVITVDFALRLCIIILFASSSRPSHETGRQELEALSCPYPPTKPTPLMAIRSSLELHEGKIKRHKALMVRFKGSF